MAKGFKQGSTGAALNFKIVGGTNAPVSPKENTIWINTDNEISCWILSPAEPDAPVAGMIWISTGSSSETAFNALKKNGISIFPMYARQYIDGVWENRSAQIYQNGTWTNLFDGYYYKEGEGSLVGSWVAYRNSSGSASAAFEKDSIIIYDTVAAYNGIAVRTEEPVDLTDVKTLYFDCESPGGLSVGIADYAFTDYQPSFVAGADGATSRDIVAVDVSNYSGKYYLAIEKISPSHTNCGIAYVYNIYGEV